jgi:hypothetical protein
LGKRREKRREFCDWVGQAGRQIDRQTERQTDRKTKRTTTTK